MQIYLRALIFPSHPLVSAETFPWHLAFTTRELGLPCRSEPEEERWRKEHPCSIHGLEVISMEGNGCVVGLVTFMLCTVCTYVWYVPLTQAPHPPGNRS